MFDYAANTYKATVDRWVDGDTVKLRVDLGQCVSVKGSYRLNLSLIHISSPRD